MDNGCTNNNYQDKNFNQINYFIDKEALYNKIAINEIKNEWEKLDANFRESDLRKKRWLCYQRLCLSHCYNSFWTSNY